MRYSALIIMCIVIITSFTGCDYINGKQKQLEEIARQKQLEMEAMARRKANEIKQDIQDKIDNKIDELAGGVKDNLNIMGEDAISGDDAESTSSPEDNTGDDLNTDTDDSGVELGDLPVS